MTKEEKQNKFIDKLNKLYGNKYDYSKVDYYDSKSKITLICPIHGEFTINASELLKGCGCKKCRHEKEFIEKSKEIHHNKYDYSKVIYHHCNKPVCIICPEHGEFCQKPSHHLNGNGCKLCSKIKVAKQNRLTQNEFIEKANKIHNNRYDYSKSKYITWETPVCIICPEHGEFWQKPAQHLRGAGCTKCAITSRTNLRSSNVEEFIEKSRKIHGDKYDYTNVIYKNAITKVCIICPEHGEFMQKPNSHLNGSGCPKCNSSGGEQMIMSFLDNKNINYDFNKYFKWMDKLQLDFYISEYKTAIEVQGKQHFKEKKFFEKLNDIQKRDNKKRKLCEENNVRLFYFATYKYDFPYKVYTDLNEMWKDIEST